MSHEDARAGQLNGDVSFCTGVLTGEGAEAVKVCFFNQLLLFQSFFFYINSICRPPCDLVSVPDRISPRVRHIYSSAG